MSQFDNELKGRNKTKKKKKDFSNLSEIFRKLDMLEIISE